MQTECHADHLIETTLQEQLECSTAIAVPRNFAELVERVTGWSDLKASARSVHLSCLRTMALVAVTAAAHRRHELGVQHRKQIDLRAVPCEVQWLNNHIFEVAPKTVGHDGTNGLGGAVTSLRTALRRVGLLDEKQPKVPADAGPWRHLLDALDKRARRQRLQQSRFSYTPGRELNRDSRHSHEMVRPDFMPAYVFRINDEYLVIISLTGRSTAISAGPSSGNYHTSRSFSAVLKSLTPRWRCQAQSA